MTWSAPAECPSPGELQDWLAVYAPTAPDRAPFSAQASVIPTATGYRLDLQIDGGGRTDTRRIEAESCRVLAQACALLVAVHVNALTTAAVQQPVRPTPPGPDAEPSVTTVPAPPLAEESVTAMRVPMPASPLAEESVTAMRRPASTPSPVDPEPPPSPVERPTVFVTTMLGGGALLLPQWAFGGALGIGMDTGRWRIEGGGSTSIWPSVRYPTQPSITARFALLEGRVRGCAVLPVRPRSRARVTVPICVGIRGGALRARGLEGIQTPRVRWAPWAAGTAGTSLVFRLHPRVGLRGGIDMAMAWNRPQYSVGTELPARLSFWRLGAELFAAVELHLSYPHKKSSQKPARPR